MGGGGMACVPDPALSVRSPSSLSGGTSTRGSVSASAPSTAAGAVSSVSAGASSRVENGLGRTDETGKMPSESDDDDADESAVTSCSSESFHWAWCSRSANSSRSIRLDERYAWTPSRSVSIDGSASVVASRRRRASTMMRAHSSPRLARRPGSSRTATNEVRRLMRDEVETTGLDAGRRVRWAKRMTCRTPVISTRPTSARTGGKEGEREMGRTQYRTLFHLRSSRNCWNALMRSWTTSLPTLTLSCASSCCDSPSATTRTAAASLEAAEASSSTPTGRAGRPGAAGMLDEGGADLAASGAERGGSGTAGATDLSESWAMRAA